MSILARLILACLVSAASPTPSADAQRPDDTQATHVDSATQVAGESFSKLRKIHLVRPDLIAYPLVTDFIC